MIGDNDALSWNLIICTHGFNPGLHLHHASQICPGSIRAQPFSRAGLSQPGLDPHRQRLQCRNFHLISYKPRWTGVTVRSVIGAIIAFPHICNSCMLHSMVVHLNDLYFQNNYSNLLCVNRAQLIPSMLILFLFSSRIMCGILLSSIT